MSVLYLDIDTQLDFLYPAGALYVPGAERLVPAIAALNGQAPQLVSTVDAHSEDDPEFNVWPKHCVAGTLGQQKAVATLLANRVVVPNTQSLGPIGGAKQIIIEKQTVDVFQARHLAGIIQQLNPDRFVLYGVVTEICVLYAFRGLLRFGKPITVVPHAIQSLTAEANQRAIDEMRSGGACFGVPA